MEKGHNIEDRNLHCYCRKQRSNQEKASNDSVTRELKTIQNIRKLGTDNNGYDQHADHDNYRVDKCPSHVGCRKCFHIV